MEEQLIPMDETGLKKINIGYEHMTLEKLETGFAGSRYMMDNSPFMKNKSIKSLWWAIYMSVFNQAIKNALSGKAPYIQIDEEEILLITQQKNMRKINETIKKLEQYGVLVKGEQGYLVMHPDVDVEAYQQALHSK